MGIVEPQASLKVIGHNFPIKRVQGFRLSKPRQSQAPTGNDGLVFSFFVGVVLPSYNEDLQYSLTSHPEFRPYPGHYHTRIHFQPGQVYTVKRKTDVKINRSNEKNNEHGQVSAVSPIIL